MKLAFLVDSYYSGGLGTISHVIPLTRELKKQKIFVDVFSFRFHPPIIGKVLHTISCGFKKLADYDVIHSQEGAGVFIRHKKVEFVAHVPPVPQEVLSNLFFRTVIKSSIKTSDHVITPSYYTKHCLEKGGFSAEKPITVIHHGIDRDIFKRDASLRIAIREKYKLNGFVALTVGRMTRRKNQDDILYALSQLSGITLLLVGDGPERKNLSSLARKLSVKTLHFYNVPKKLLVGLYNAADVYLHTALLEGFGFPILEALSCGTPVIAYRTADFDYVIGDGGYLITQGNIKELRDKILYLKENEYERKKLSRNALAQSQRFSWSEVARKYIRIYKEVAC